MDLAADAALPVSPAHPGADHLVDRAGGGGTGDDAHGNRADPQRGAEPDIVATGRVNATIRRADAFGEQPDAPDGAAERAFDLLEPSPGRYGIRGPAEPAECDHNGGLPA
jgi:hypothetical protein